MICCIFGVGFLFVAIVNTQQLFDGGPSPRVDITMVMKLKEDMDDLKRVFLQLNDEITTVKNELMSARSVCNESEKSVPVNNNCGSTNNTYTIITYTGDLEKADTNADMYVTLYWETGHSDELYLDNLGKNDFLRGRADVFTMSLPYTVMMPINKVSIRFDINSPDIWYLDKILIIDGNHGMAKEFDCYCWFDSINYERELFENRSCN